jgi:AMP-binding enzyme
MIQAERLRVVDEDANDVPADGATMGEIVMRGNNVMKGYFEDEEATAEAFRGGWFHSGDLGVVHSDGYVQLLDRAKDVVISGGENFSTVRSSGRCSPTRPCWRQRSSGCPTRSGASGPRPSSCSSPARRSARRRSLTT